MHLKSEESSKAYHLIKVKDNGIRFPQEDSDRIFNVLPDCMAIQNLGALVWDCLLPKKVVENHEGYIWVESTLGQGATFKILLPFE